MELLEGERLGQLIQRAGGRLPRRYALAIIRDIGAAIAHAHSRGVVHADLKPHNIMITRDGHVRVLDFGSGAVRPGEPWISELSPGGDYRQATPQYASCEQLQGWCADPRDDIYALACMAYQLLAGKHPFDNAHRWWRAVGVCGHGGPPPCAATTGAHCDADFPGVASSAT